MVKDGNGKFTYYWYENGQKISEGTYKNGRKDGLWTRWYENGQKENEGNYKNGKHDGIWTYWDKNDGKGYKGKVERKVDEDGYFFNSYSDGLLIPKSHYRAKDGKAEGLVTQWYDNGNKKSEGTYKDGREISSKRWYIDGSVRK